MGQPVRQSGGNPWLETANKLLPYTGAMLFAVTGAPLHARQSRHGPWTRVLRDAVEDIRVAFEGQRHQHGDLRNGVTRLLHADRIQLLWVAGSDRFGLNTGQGVRRDKKVAAAEGHGAFNQQKCF